MKYKIDRDKLTDFEFTVLKYIRQSVPFTYSKKEDTIIFKEETKEFIENFHEACDGSIKEVTWNEDNAEYFRKHRDSMIEALQYMANNIMSDEEHPSAVSFVSLFDYFNEDDITYDDIAKGLFDTSLKPYVYSWEFHVQSVCTIWAVEQTIFNLQNNLEEIEEDEVQD